MRKPRDIDAELQALEAKAKTLRAQKIAQLGELVVATGADGLPPWGDPVSMLVHGRA